MPFEDEVPRKSKAPLVILLVLLLAIAGAVGYSVYAFDDPNPMRLLELM